MCKKIKLISTLVIFALFISCENEDPIAEPDEVLFDNQSSSYVSVIQNDVRDPAYLIIFPSSDKPMTNVPEGVSFSVKIGYGDDVWSYRHAIIDSNYEVSAGETIIITSDYKLEKK